MGKTIKWLVAWTWNGSLVNLNSCLFILSIIGCVCGLNFKRRVEETIFSDNYMEEIIDLFQRTLKEYLILEKHYDKETRHMKNKEA